MVLCSWSSETILLYYPVWSTSTSSNKVDKLTPRHKLFFALLRGKTSKVCLISKCQVFINNVWQFGQAFTHAPSSKRTVLQCCYEAHQVIAILVGCNVYCISWPEYPKLIMNYIFQTSSDTYEAKIWYRETDHYTTWHTACWVFERAAGRIGSNWYRIWSATSGMSV